MVGHRYRVDIVSLLHTLGLRRSSSVPSLPFKCLSGQLVSSLRPGPSGMPKPLALHEISRTTTKPEQNRAIVQSIMAFYRRKWVVLVRPKFASNCPGNDYGVFLSDCTILFISINENIYIYILVVILHLFHRYHLNSRNKISEFGCYWFNEIRLLVALESRGIVQTL